MWVVEDVPELIYCLAISPRLIGNHALDLPQANVRSVSLLRSKADRIAWERTSSRNRITVAASVRLCVGGKFCRSKSCATLMASIIIRSELMEKTHTTLPFRSQIIAQSSTESTSIFMHLPIWHR